jgi:hypothetical protein
MEQVYARDQVATLSMHLEVACHVTSKVGVGVGGFSECALFTPDLLLIRTRR